MLRVPLAVEQSDADSTAGRRRRRERHERRDELLRALGVDVQPRQLAELRVDDGLHHGQRGDLARSVGNPPHEPADARLDLAWHRRPPRRTRPRRRPMPRRTAAGGTAAPARSPLRRARRGRGRPDRPPASAARRGTRPTVSGFWMVSGATGATSSAQRASSTTITSETPIPIKDRRPVTIAVGDWRKAARPPSESAPAEESRRVSGGTTRIEPPASPELSASTATEISRVPDAWIRSRVGVGSRKASNPGCVGSLTVETLLPARLVRTVSTPTYARTAPATNVTVRSVENTIIHRRDGRRSLATKCEPAVGRTCSSVGAVMGRPGRAGGTRSSPPPRG